ncbi:MFS transporter [Streptomyces caniferus]|uniref:MFS transporter n=1 Tax=Streptomyces caniferus TaxID=285557 RepID=UPI00381916C9
MANAKRPSLWRNRDFSLFWGGQSLSLIGSQVSVVALPLMALETLHATTFKVGLLTTFSTLPWLLVSLPAGVIVDRCRKRKVMFWCDIGRFLTLSSVPVAAGLGILSLTHLYVVALLSGTLAVFFSSAYLSYPAMLVDPDQLVDANGKVSSASAVAGVVGPSLSGFLVGITSAARAVAVDGVSYLVSAISLVFIRHSEPRRTPQAARQGKFRREMAEGLKIIFRDRTMASLTFANAWGNLLLTAFNSLWLLYAVRGLGWTPRTVGLVMGISAVGGVIGSLLAKPVIQRYGLIRVLLFGQFLLAPGQVTAVLMPRGSLGEIAICAGLMATLTSAIMYDIAQRTYRIASCAPEMLGRLNATAKWIQWGTRPLAGVLSGALGTWLGLRPSILLFSVLLFLCPVALWRSPLVQEYRCLRESASESSAPAATG